MLKLRNHFIFPPIKLGYAKNQDGKVDDAHKNFYDVRSRHVGAVTYEPLYLHKGLRELPTQLGIDEDDKVEGLRELNAMVHKNGAKAIAHINHPGRMANPKIPGNYWLSSTDKPCENGGASPVRMDMLEDKQETIGLFVEAAKRAVIADFDIIELQFGHGYLFAQFLSPKVNDRTDEYGGSFENRYRFPLEVLQEIKAAVKIPVIVRMSADEMTPDGFHLEEMLKFSKILEQNGAAAIHVTAGTVCSTPPWFFQHMFIPKGKTWEFADEIRKEIDIPVIYVGMINTKDDIDNLLNTRKAEYLALGRSLVADPDFVGKYLGQVEGNIIPCLACAEGCLGGVKSGQGLQCLVNPEVGRETNAVGTAAKVRNFAVVGGGLAGMEAAITLKKRGHAVDLFEKDKLGGQFNLAPLTPHKKSMYRLVPYFKNEIEDCGVNVIYKEASREDLLNEYDGVVLATGSVPSIPKIEGLKTFFWADILLDDNLPENSRVLIIGGGLIGVDIATALIPRNNQVIIVKRTADFGEDMEMIAKALSLKIMEENNTAFSDHTHIRKIAGNTVYADREGKPIQFDNIDIIVVSTGMESYEPLSEKLRDQISVYIIGDAREIGNAQNAIKDAYETTRKL